VHGVVLFSVTIVTRGSIFSSFTLPNLSFFFRCCYQVQPVAELVELSRRWAADGRSIRLNEVIAEAGTLRRSGSLRHRGGTKVREQLNKTMQLIS